MRGRGRKGPNPLTRTYESNGPDVKIRGTAQHIAEKYQQLARDAQVSGDRVMSENYNQHAEHYLRIIAAAQPQVRDVASSSVSHRAEDDLDDGQEENASVEDVSAPDAEQPVIGLDDPQPFIDEMPGVAKDEDLTPISEVTADVSEGAKEAASKADEDGDGDDDKPRRRARGTRGRGLRRTASAPVSALPDQEEAGAEEAKSEGDGSDDKDAKPRTRRTPRARTPRVRTPRTRTSRAKGGDGEGAEPALEPVGSNEG
ncbi:DUF4167 domain-containing protein [Rhodobacteraceae bacterium RKSG542]|nr:DUF4167 domain-containing protein [Pseudovibrio flavus]